MHIPALFDNCCIRDMSGLLANAPRHRLDQRGPNSRGGGGGAAAISRLALEAGSAARLSPVRAPQIAPTIAGRHRLYLTLHPEKDRRPAPPGLTTHARHQRRSSYEAGGPVPVTERRSAHPTPKDGC